MGNRGFRSKPSPTHIIWIRGGDRTSTGGKKQFDTDYFGKWAKRAGFDFEQETRVDHDRAEEPRTQHRVVFRWGTSESETISLGDEEWSMDAQKTPRTFIEVDDAGLARIKGWTVEATLDVVEMRHKGADLLIESADGEKKRLNAHKFVSDPRDRQQDGA